MAIVLWRYIEVLFPHLYYERENKIMQLLQGIGMGLYCIMLNKSSCMWLSKVDGYGIVIIIKQTVLFCWMSEWKKSLNWS